MKKLFAAVMLLTMSCGLMAQSNDPVIFEIGGKPIYKSEFMKEFLHSVGKDPAAAPTACTYEKRKALEDYVQLFVNFRTKLADAYAQGMDKDESLCSELATYRNELAAPYLIDSASMMELMKEAYERNHYVLHAAHILIKVGPNAAPEDTLKAYQKALEVYNRVTEGGEDFGAVSTELVKAELKEKETQARGSLDGDLGCFTAFDMVYPFESAAYSLQPGEISKPVRSRFGYHVIKLFERTPYYGRTTLRHIWMRDEVNPQRIQNLINLAYKKLQSGEDFAKVARHNSDDRSSAQNGGLMTDMTVNQLPPFYVTQLAKLKEGQFSEPFHSEFGWHIVQLEKREPMPSLDDLLPYYKQRLARDQRNKNSQEVFIRNTQQKYGYIDYTQEYAKVKKGKKWVKSTTPMANIDQAKSIVADSIFVRRWVYDSTLITDTTTLFRIGDKRFNQNDFCRWLATHQKTMPAYDLNRYVDNRFDEYKEAMVLEYADQRLEIENSEFRDLVEEYRHGLMIFAYNDKMVWTQAIVDTIGFQQYYDIRSKEVSLDNPDDSMYFWGTRARVSVYSISDSAWLAPEKAQSIVLKGIKKQCSSNEVVAMLKKKADASKGNIASRLELPEENHQELLARNEWKPGVYMHPNQKGYQILVVEGLINPTLKTQQEARGYYINDYQNYLDEQLIARLRQQYNVTIHQDVIDEITY